MIVLTLLVLDVFAPAIASYDPKARVDKPFRAPSAEHKLGTNDIGQDIFSQLIYGARVSLLVGTTVGPLAGFYPRRFGPLLMRFVDVILVLPFLPLLIILAAFLGKSLMNTTLIIGCLIWAGSARVIRSQVLTLSKQEFVEAARSTGARDRHITLRHILPLVLLLTMGQFVQATSSAILLEASLSFLGLGDPLQKSWGSILYWAQVLGAFLTPAWLWWVLPPGLMIGAASLGFAMIGFAHIRKWWGTSIITRWKPWRRRP